MLTCSGCKFASRSDKIQTGCELYKLDKFIELNNARMESGHDSYSLSRICMFHRPDNWNGDINKETQVKLGYIFIIKDKNDIDIFKNNIDLIKNKDPLWIGVLHSFNSINNELCEILNNVKCKYNIVCQYTKDFDINRIDQFLPYMKAGWTLVNIVGEPFLAEAKEKLNHFINYELGMAGIIKYNNESLNGFCFFNIFFKFYKGSKIQYNEIDDTYEYKNFEYKVQEQNSDMIKLWENIV